MIPYLQSPLQSLLPRLQTPLDFTCTTPATSRTSNSSPEMPPGLRIDPAKDEYAAVSWCRMAGKGRVFYTSLGHREDLWSAEEMPGRINSPETSKQYQAHILGGIKWALGLAEGSATPNPEVK